MCMSELPFDGGFKAGPNYCSIHPNFDMGSGAYSPLTGFFRYQRRCERCIAATIQDLPKDAYLVDHLKREHDLTLDPNTIQVIMDVLDQKLGIRP